MPTSLVLKAFPLVWSENLIINILIKRDPNIFLYTPSYPLYTIEKCGATL